MFCKSNTIIIDSQVLNYEKKCHELSQSGQFETCDSIAELMCILAEKKGDKQAKAKSLYYLGIYDGNADHVNYRIEKLLLAEKIAENLNNDTLLSMIYNAHGIYELVYYKHFASAGNYFSKSITLAKKINDERRYLITAQNLSSVLSEIGDTIGINYDREMFDYGKRYNDTILLQAAALHCANYYSLRNFNEKQALFYLKFVKNSYRSCYYEVLGNIALQKKIYNDAEAYYEQSIKEEPNYFSYFRLALLQYDKREYVKSVENIKRAIDCYHRNVPDGEMSEFSCWYAKNMAALENFKEAYFWMDKYSRQADSTHNLKNDEAIKHYRILYDTEKKEQKIKALHLYAEVGFVIFSCIVLCVLILYFKEKRTNKRIIKQNRNFFIVENNLLQKLKDAQQTKPDTLKNQTDKDNINLQKAHITSGGIDTDEQTVSDRVERIYKLIVDEVVDNKCYKDPSISRDVLCQRCGCNRTYLTQAIKEKTGLSYPQYMNSIRIHEAIKVLTESVEKPNMRTLAFDLGFLSVNSFYTAFKKQTGMSPMMYYNTSRGIVDTEQ